MSHIYAGHNTVGASHWGMAAAAWGRLARQVFGLAAEPRQACPGEGRDRDCLASPYDLAACLGRARMWVKVRLAMWMRLQIADCRFFLLSRLLSAGFSGIVSLSLPLPAFLDGDTAKAVDYTIFPFFEREAPT